MSPADKKKNILITGCSSGIGKYIAKGLVSRGYRVFATARRAADVELLLSEGYESIQLDLDSSASINNAVDEILRRTNGHLYALFNNGAYGQPGAVEDLSRDVMRKQFETNLFGTQELTNRIIPVMRQQGYGRIVQNSSVLGLIVLPYRGAYNATKFALEALTDTMRLELTDTNIHISLIEPGPIESLFRKNAYHAFLNNINKDNSAHKQIYLAMEQRLSKSGPAAPFTLTPKAVFKKVIHALESPRPKIRYYVTFPTYLFATLRHLLSYRTLDQVLRRVANDENKK